jgi:hypothetical protein
MTTPSDSGATRVEPTGPTGPATAAGYGGRHATVPSQYSPSATDHPDYYQEAPPPPPGMRRDGIRWGAVWAGAVIALATFIVLQLLFFALGWLDLGFDSRAGGVAATIVSGVIALVAFFVGGLVAGATSLWTGRKEGMLQGVAMWAVTVVGILAITLIGGGALLGSAADAAAQVTAPRPAEMDVVELTQAARNAAGWSALGLGLAMLASALGGVMGSRMRPQGDRTTTVH